MVPRVVDPFKPEPEASYSKSQVNRAGDLMRDFLAAPEREGEQFKGFDLDELFDAMTKLTWWRSLHAAPLNKVAANLRYHVKKEGALVDGRIDVTQRLKRRSTIISKLGREPGMDATRMADIGGVRARLPSTRHVAAVSRRLKKTWTVVRTRDYISEPKPSGYRALHHVVRRDGRLVEIQLRTVLQDAWANQVEEDGRRLGEGFKFGGGNADVHAYYGVVAEAFAVMDDGQTISADLASRLNESFAVVKDQLGRSGTGG